VKKNLKKTYTSINKKELSISVNTQEFENNLVYNYSLLMFIISFRYLKKSLKLLKSFILILSYALIDYLTIRVFKKSISELEGHFPSNRLSQFIF
jgi:hypothetical protein